MIPIIVSGASGQLGQACVSHLTFQDGYSVFSFDRRQLDIADQDKIERILDTLPQTKYWINCAAYTKVDDAETHEKEAELYNTIAPGLIAKACKERDVHLFDFSSDYVYHNALRRPLTETDPVEPKGAYARSKRNGELEIINSGVRHTILRTSWVYGPGGHNFVNTMIRLGAMKDHLRIVGDQLGAPTYTIDIVNALSELIRHDFISGDHQIQGIFNFANAGQVTWADFAKSIFNLQGLTTKVESISTAEYGAPAARPPYSVLNCGKITSLLSASIPPWENALGRYLHDFVNVPKP
jgi:dTDP-4-dehydrorhamnose reductase